MGCSNEKDGQQSNVPPQGPSAAAEKFLNDPVGQEPAGQVAPRPKQIVPAFEELKKLIGREGKIWEPDGVYHKVKKKLGAVTGKTLVSRMNSQGLKALQDMVLPHIQAAEHQGTRDLLENSMKTAEKFKGKQVQLPYILILHASKWHLTLTDGEQVKDASFFELDFRGEPKALEWTAHAAKVKLAQNECTRRIKCNCKACELTTSQLSGAMASALVDSFSGPMEIAITSCIGLPQTWNFSASIAQMCGISFCCYFLPRNFLWFEVWAANMRRDALVGKSTTKRFAIAIVYDGGDGGNYTQQMELPFAYLYDLPVLLLEASKMRKVFIETGLMERTVQFVTGSNTLRLWSHRGDQEGEMTVSNTVNCVDITHDWIFAGDSKGTVHKYSRSNFVEACFKKLHGDQEVNALKVALGLVFTASNDQTIKISGFESLEPIDQFKDPQGLGRVLCIAVGIEHFFAGGGQGVMRFSHNSLTESEEVVPRRASEKTLSPSEKKLPPKPIKPEGFEGKFEGSSHMALNGRSLFMISKADPKGQLCYLKDADMLEDALVAKVVFKADERVQSLALGGKELFVATRALIYKLDAANPKTGPTAAIDVTPLHNEIESKVFVLQVFGDKALVGYFPGSTELGIFNTNNGDRVTLPPSAFEHKADVSCIAVG